MITVQDADFCYGSRAVLQGAHLQVERGELVCVVGRNGSGKSTLLRMMSGETLPTRGSVLFDGVDTRALSAAQLAERRAVLPQASRLNFNFAVSDVVAMGRIPHRARSSAAEDQDVVQAALEAVGLSGFGDRRYTRLSGGEKQRVHLARVLAQVWPTADRAPGFVLLDEPTSALDLAHVYGVLERVKVLCRAGLGAVAVLHDLNAAAQFADRIVMLFEGRVVASGAPAAVITAANLRNYFDLEARIERGAAGRLFVLPLSPSSFQTPQEATC